MAQLGALACPNCGGPVQLRGYAQTVNATCPSCLSILDTRSPELQILQQAAAQVRVEPLIPLGSRGKLDGVAYEVIGFQQRTITVEGVDYSWREYLLFNPFRGYHYLSEYDGHWNDIQTLRAVPQPASKYSRPGLQYDGVTYAHFQHAQARTTFVLGEFPWQVRTGDTVEVDDYIAPPLMLSSERTGDEVVWSQGAYRDPKEIWQAFGLSGAPPQPRGVFANQPSPHKAKVRSVWWRMLLLLAGLIIAACVVFLTSRRDSLFEQRYSFASNAVGPAAFVTPPFEVPEESNVDIRIRLDRTADAAFDVSLINEETGRARDMGDDVERTASIEAGRVSPGRYYLRVEPHLDTDPLRPEFINYSLAVTTGSVSWLPLIFAFLLLLIPPFAVTAREVSFEGSRWAESDYGSMHGTAEDGGEDEE